MKKELMWLFVALIVIGIFSIWISNYIPMYQVQRTNSFGITPSGQPGIKIGPIVAPADGSNPSVGISP